MTRRFLLGLLLVISVIGMLPPAAVAVGLCGVFSTYPTPIATITALSLNQNFVQAATTNGTTDCVSGFSSTLTQMNQTVDPFPSGTASLSTSLSDELQRIRFVLTRMHGATNWYTETQFSLGAGAGRLTLVSATSIQFCPYNGNMFRIPSTAKTYQIPTACWTAANTSVSVAGTATLANLAASTTYWVYLFDSGGTPTFDFYTSSTHTPDSLTGIEIRTSDNTRVLIGLIRTNGSSQFQDDATLRGVRSWANRLAAVGNVNSGATVAVTSSTMAEYRVLDRIGFVAWADDLVTLSISGYAFTTNAVAASIWAVVAPGVDAAAQVPSLNVGDTLLSGRMGASVSGTYTVTEAFHNATPMIASGDNTSSWNFVLAHTLGIR